MAVVNPSAFGPKPQWVDATGAPCSGYQLFAYVAGSVSTKQNTYTDYTGTVANANPIVLDSSGYVPDGLFFTAGQTYKLVLAPPTDTDPPTSPIWTEDGLRGQNDTTVTVDQWVPGPAPTYVSGTQFTLAGDQTSDFQVGRRVRITDAVTTKYGYITASTYDGISLTTVTIANDGAALVNPLSAVSYGLISATNTSMPAIILAGSGISVTYVAGKPTIASSAVAANDVCDFRLTLTTGVPVTTADVTGASTLYASPYKGNRIALYNGSVWNVRTSAEFSVALSGLTPSLPYDVYCYDNAGVPTLEYLAWTSGTARATALSMLEGVYIKNGDATRRYMGTFYATAATTTNDSAATRYLWNYYNRQARPLLNKYTADRTTSSATYAEPNTEIRCQFVLGVAEDPVVGVINGSVQNGAASSTRATAVAFDSATAASAAFQSASSVTGANSLSPIAIANEAFLAVGFHYMTLLSAASAGTNTYATATVLGTSIAVYLGGQVQA